MCLCSHRSSQCACRVRMLSIECPQCAWRHLGEQNQPGAPLGTRACDADTILLGSARVSPGQSRRAWAGSSVVEHSTFNRVVVGSTPTRPTLHWALSISIHRALAPGHGLGYRLYMRRAALMA